MSDCEACCEPILDGDDIVYTDDLCAFWHAACVQSAPLPRRLTTVWKRRIAQHVKWREKRLREQNGVCFYCLCKPRKTTLDHQTPLSRGGRDIFANVVAACYPCNQRKGSMTTDEFRKPRNASLFSR